MRKGKSFLLSALALFVVWLLPWYPYDGAKGFKLISFARGADFCNGVGMAFVGECSWFYPLSMSILSIIVILVIIGVIFYFKEKRN